MMRVFIYPFDELSFRLANRLRRHYPTLDILDFPEQGSVLFTRGDVDFENGVVYLPEPVNFSNFKAIFVEAEPPATLKHDVPISICPDIFSIVSELLSSGEEISVENLRKHGCIGLGDFTLCEDITKDIPRDYPPNLEGMNRLARLVGMGALERSDLDAWMIGVYTLKGLKIHVPKNLTPLSIVGVELPVNVSVEYGSSVSVGKPIAYIPVHSKPGQRGKLKVRLEIDNVKIDVAEIPVKTEYRQLKPVKRIGKIEPLGGVCRGDLLVFWEKSLKALDVISEKIVWTVPLKVSGAVISGDTLYAWSSDGSIYGISIDSGEMIWEESVRTRVNFACVSGKNLALMTVEGLLIYDLDSPPTVKHELKFTGLLTCSEKAVYLADGDSISVIDWNSEIVGVLKFEERIWDLISVKDMLVVAHGGTLESVDSNFKTVAKAKLPENIDSLHRWRDELVVLTKSGKVVILHPENLKIAGEVEGCFRDLITCDWIYAIEKDGSLCVVLGPER